VRLFDLPLSDHSGYIARRMSQPHSLPALRVRAIVNKDGSILMARLTVRPVAFLPGGRVEPGETLEVALRRELIEETGATAATLSYLGCIENLWMEHSRTIHDRTHFFLADVPALSPEVTPTCNDDGVEMFWMPIEHLEKTPVKPRIQKAFIRHTINGDRSAWWAFVDEREQRRA
jgi:8-oxo-dGTP diphosphatase